MKKFLALVALLFALTVPQCGYAELLYGTVKEAIDGDTIKVELASGAVETVRYLLIDQARGGGIGKRSILGQQGACAGQAGGPRARSGE